jgi:hypothetical protein
MANDDNIESLGEQAVADLLSQIKDVLNSINENVKGTGSGSGGGADVPRDKDRYSQTDALRMMSRGASNFSQYLGDRREQGNVSRPPGHMEAAADRSSRFLQSAADKYAPQARAVSRIATSVGAKYGKMTTNLNQIGNMQGYSSEGGIASIGGIGFSTPFGNEAMQKGMEFKMDALGSALSGGITYGQAEKIQQTVVGLGYTQDTDKYKQMTSALKNLNKSNSMLAQDPLTAEMYDKATRYGQTSMEDMTEIMNKLGDSAKGANVNLKQMASDADKFGQYYKQTGGLASEGNKASTEISTALGIPPNVALQMQENGLVKANLMRNSKLLPWQLGQASSGQRIDAMYQTMDMLYKQLGPAPKDTVTRDEVTGFAHIQSGQDKRDADIAQYMGVDLATVKDLRKNEGRAKARSALQNRFDDYEKTIKMTGGSADYMKGIMTSEGGKSGTLGALVGEMQKAGLDKEAQKRVIEAGKSLSEIGNDREGLREKARAQSEQLNKELSGQTQDDKNATVTVQLSEEAARYFNIDGGRSKDIKADANAGNGSTNSAAMIPPSVGARPGRAGIGK